MDNFRKQEGKVALSFYSVSKLNILLCFQGVELIRAKKKCVTLLAMGCTTTLNVTPRSMGGSIKVEHVEQSGENADEEMDTGWLGGNMEDDHMDVDEPTQSPKKPGRSVGKKKDLPTFSLSLFHGDTVVFFGDDFEV